MTLIRDYLFSRKHCEDNNLRHLRLIEPPLWLVIFILIAGLSLISCDQKFSTPEYDIYYDEDFNDVPQGYKAPAAADSRACKVLFLGNSLTSYNSQTSIFRGLAQSANKRIFVNQYCQNGAQLDYHRYSLMSRQKISEQKWDFVILQEAVAEVSSSEGRADILPFIEGLKTFIFQRNSRARVIYFMPYANRDGLDIGFMHLSYDQHQINLIEGVQQYAQLADVMIAPIGQAWRQVRRERPSIELYREDKAHPAYAGSYLGACVYYATIFQDSVTPINYKGMLDSATAVYLRSVATRVVLDSLTTWRIRPLDAGQNWNITPDDTSSAPRE